MKPGPTKTYGKKTEVRFGKNDIKKESVKDFLDDRFKAFVPDHNYCSLIGSTSLYLSNTSYNPYLNNDLNKKRAGAHLVCDAFNMAPMIFSSDYMALSQYICVTDGLGYDEADPMFNDSVASISDSVSKLWIDSKISGESDFRSTSDTLLKITKNAETALPRKLRDYEPTCSLVAGKIDYIDGHWVGSFTNIGDGMIVIIDKNLVRVKDLIPATVWHRSKGNYSPESIQSVLRKPEFFGRIQEKKIDLQEGDVVMYMTDGMYAGLPLSTTDSDTQEESWGKSYPIFKKTELIRSDIENILRPLSRRSNVSAFEVSQAMLSEQTKRYFDVLKNADSILKKVASHIEFRSNIKDFSLSDYLEWSGEHDPDFYISLKTFLDTQGHHDGYEFELSVAKVSDLQEVIGKQEYGDCTTVVTQIVPNYEQELLKKYLSNPDPKIMDILYKRIPDLDINAMIDTLSEHQCSPIDYDSNGVYLKKLKIKSQFSTREIKKITKTFIDEYPSDSERQKTSMSKKDLDSSYSPTSNIVQQRSAVLRFKGSDSTDKTRKDDAKKSSVSKKPNLK